MAEAEIEPEFEEVPDEEVRFIASIAEKQGIRFDDEGGTIVLEIPQSEEGNFARALCLRHMPIVVTMRPFEG